MQACEHGPRLDDPGDGSRGAFSRGLHPYIEISAQTSLAAAAVDMWQK